MQQTKSEGISLGKKLGDSMVKMVQQRQNNAQDGKSESPEENKSFVTSKTTINITNMKKQG